MDRIAHDRINIKQDRRAAAGSLTRNRVYNGMPARELGSEGWHKPWSGGNGGNCLEAMKLSDGRIAVRQSTDPDGPALIYTSAEMTAFIEGAKAGEADFLLS
jgi:hypothetical protein